MVTLCLLLLLLSEGNSAQCLQGKSYHNFIVITICGIITIIHIFFILSSLLFTLFSILVAEDDVVVAVNVFSYDCRDTYSQY